MFKVICTMQCRADDGKLYDIHKLYLWPFVPFVGLELEVGLGELFNNPVITAVVWHVSKETFYALCDPSEQGSVFIDEMLDEHEWNSGAGNFWGA